MTFATALDRCTFRKVICSGTDSRVSVKRAVGDDVLLVILSSSMFINPSFAFVCTAHVLSRQIIRASCGKARRHLPIVVQKLAEPLQRRESDPPERQTFQ